MTLQDADAGARQGKPLASFEQHRSLVAEVRACAGSYVTNCYLMPADLRSAIEAGQLSLLRDEPGCAVVLFRKPTHDQVFIHWADAAGEDAQVEASLPGPPAMLQGPCVIENPFSSASPEAPMEGGPKRLRQLSYAWGFAPIRTSRRLELSFDDLNPAISAQPPSGFCVTAARPEDHEAIARMLAEGFDPRCDFIPTASELAQAIAQGRVLCAWPKPVEHGDNTLAPQDAEPAAFLHFEDGPVTLLRHLYVSREMRGRGLARALLAAYLMQEHNQQASRAILWVRDDNEPALALYASFGYQFAGRRSEEYFKER